MSVQHLITAAAAATITVGALLGTGTACAVTGDPYTSDGTWMVPSEITPGTYRVALTTGAMGYSKICADYTCEIGTSGFIANELYRGPGILVIPATAVSVELSRISLKRMG
jgi:hypothetical protein